MKFKKGSSHVEVIISFVIFIGFLIFFYMIIGPAIKGPRSDDTILEDAKDRILNKIEGEVEEYELVIPEEISCIKIKKGGDEVVIKEGDKILDSGYETKYVSGVDKFGDPIDIATSFLIIERPESFDDPLTLYSSEEFIKIGLTPSCPIGDPINPCGTGICYSLNFQKKREHIFKSKILELKERYEGNEKDVLKKELKIPDKYGYWFDILDRKGGNSILGTEWEDQTDAESENIYVGELPIIYIDESQDPEDKKQGYLRIKIWG